MGLRQLDNTPREVKAVDRTAGGRLDAMMLDMKRTFDEIVESHSTPEKAAQILANPFYQALSSSFSGTQEYMAMEKLGQLRAQSDAEARRLGPDRRRHAAVPVGAGLPGRAAAARVVPGRPADQAARGAGPGRRPGLPEGGQRRGQRGHRGADQDPRRPDPHRRPAVRLRTGHHVRRVPRARRRDVPAVEGTRYGVRGGRGAGARRDAGGVLLRGAAGRRADAVGRAGAQPGPRRRPGGALRRAERGRGRAPGGSEEQGKATTRLRAHGPAATAARRPDPDRAARGGHGGAVPWGASRRADGAGAGSRRRRARPGRAARRRRRPRASNSS